MEGKKMGSIDEVLESMGIIEEVEKVLLNKAEGRAGHLRKRGQPRISQTLNDVVAVYEEYGDVYVTVRRTRGEITYRRTEQQALKKLEGDRLDEIMREFQATQKHPLRYSLTRKTIGEVKEDRILYQLLRGLQLAFDGHGVLQGGLTLHYLPRRLLPIVEISYMADGFVGRGLYELVTRPNYVRGLYELVTRPNYVKVPNIVIK